MAGGYPSRFKKHDYSLPVVGEVRLFAGATAPTGWLFCDGQTLLRATYPELWGVLGTTYGAGNGTTNFVVPDLRGRVVLHEGTGSGLTARALGATGGAETVTLTESQIPAHSHEVNAIGTAGDSDPKGPIGNLLAAHADAGTDNVYGEGAATGVMDADMIADAGGGASHANMQPFAVLNYIIYAGGAN